MFGNGWISITVCRHIKKIFSIYKYIFHGFCDTWSNKYAKNRSWILNYKTMHNYRGLNRQYNNTYPRIMFFGNASRYYTANPYGILCVALSMLLLAYEISSQHTSRYYCRVYSDVSRLLCDWKGCYGQNALLNLDVQQYFAYRSQPFQ